MTKLPFHEWLIICLLIATLSMIAFITLFKTQHDLPSPVASEHELVVAKTLRVTLKGAVARAGEYEFLKGALLQDALEAARPLPEADLSKLKTQARLRHGQVITVPQESWITVYVEGEVKEAKPLNLKKGVLVKDIIPLINLNENADTDKLNKKRRLKDQEVIRVMSKKVAKRSKKIIPVLSSSNAQSA